ncbi:MAG: GHKL domain-containing protein [Clostridia bacterium]|nr:GHKL domain-containing protein [Clostridia bacterium]
MLFICCHNDADTAQIKRHGDTFLSTRQDSDLHGFGVENMKQTVEKHGGTIEFEIHPASFAVHIMLGKE